jgi:flavodoxin I
MKTLVVYDTQFGNTENIAKAIGSAINDEVKISRIGDVAVADLNTVELLIIGSPTQGGRATKPISAFVDNLTEANLKNIKVAVFDTRLTTKLVTLFGYAGGKIASSLKSKRITLIVPVEGFLVKGAKGPLVDGEKERATAWGKKIVEAAK